MCVVVLLGEMTDRRYHRDPSTCCEKVTGTAIALLQSWMQMYFPGY